MDLELSQIGCCCLGPDITRWHLHTTNLLLTSSSQALGGVRETQNTGDDFKEGGVLKPGKWSQVNENERTERAFRLSHCVLMCLHSAPLKQMNGLCYVSCFLDTNKFTIEPTLDNNDVMNKKRTTISSLVFNAKNRNTHWQFGHIHTSREVGATRTEKESQEWQPTHRKFSRLLFP